MRLETVLSHAEHVAAPAPARKRGRPKGTESARERTRREEACRALRDGCRPGMVAEVFGISGRTLRRWAADLARSA